MDQPPRTMSFTYNGDIWLVLLSLAVCIVSVRVLLMTISRSRLRENVASKITVPFDKDSGRSSSSPATRRNPAPRNIAPKSPGAELLERQYAALKKRARPGETLAKLVPMMAIFGDLLMTISGFALANLLCQTTSFPAALMSQPMPSIANNYKLILFSSLMIFWALTGAEMYQVRNLLSPLKNWNKFIQPVLLCFFALILFDLVVQYLDPPVPWIFFLCAAFFVLS